MRKNTLLHTTIQYLLYISIFFPYLRVFQFPTEIQPNALIISSIYVIKKLLDGEKIPKMVLYLLLLTFSSAIFLFTDSFSLYVLRGIANYLSISLISIAVFMDIFEDQEVNEKLLKIIMLIWFVIGFIQKFLLPDFLTFLTLANRSSTDRGVVALAVEPSHYGFICVFFILVSIFIFKRNKKTFLVINLIQIFLFAQSSMSYFIILIGFIIWIFDLLISTNRIEKKVSYIFASICAFVFANIAILKVLPKTRLYFFVIEFYKNPISFFITDLSAGDRLGNIFYSIYGSITDFLFPHGFLYWYRYINIVKDNSYIKGITGDYKIMSAFGSGLYEMGIIGLLIITILVLEIVGRKNDKKRFLLAVFIVVIMLTAVPLGYPPFYFLIGYFIHENSKIENARTTL